ncbi:GrpB family protein [Ideonella sp. DXS29W]|uniref:GrpB family protein n=1 Tax=Ideonella lacteola TaxID=2984193 RepID=A0ABU9BSH8_9BURK
MIEIVAYSPQWAVEFEAEALAIRGALGDRVVRIEHVGSTAVPGLAAKPVIDIQVSVVALQPEEPYIAALATLGYRFISLGDFDRVYPWFAKPGDWPSSHHVHLCVAGEAQEASHLAFRDWLRADPGHAAEYEALKRQLAARHAGDSLRSVERYSLDKSSFVQRALADWAQRGRGSQIG